jgi:predicted Fe-Mo cluster-binding NifX family protein
LYCHSCSKFRFSDLSSFCKSILFFLIVDSQTEEFKTIENEAQRAKRGAGIAAAKIVASEKVKAVISGMVGPNAQMVLEQSKIKIITGISGTAKEALEKFKKGELK